MRCALRLLLLYPHERLLLPRQGICSAIGDAPEAFFGPADPEHRHLDHLSPTSWDAAVSDRTATLEYKAWRRPFRKGYMMYRTRTVLHNVSARDLKRFMLDDAIK